MPRSYKPIQLIWNYTPVLKPMPASDLPQSVDEEPAVCVRLSNKLVPYLLGLLEMYRWEDKLTGTPQEVIDGLGLFQDLLVVLTEGNCTGDNMAFKLRQNPLNSCQLQQSTDGGQTWTLAFDYAKCAGGGTQPKLSNTGTVTPLTVFNTLRVAVKNNPNLTNPYQYFPSDMNAAGIEQKWGDCAAAAYLAELFVDFWNEASKAEYEGNFSDLNGIVEGALTGIFAGALIAAGAVAKGTIAGIPAGVALDATALAAPIAANFYADISVGAFRAIYEALGGGATPPIHPLMVTEVKCALIEQLKAARTIGNFQAVSGALIPEAVADAWNAFATLEMWTLFNTFSISVDKNTESASQCCGETCYNVPPGTMVIEPHANLTKSARIEGHYLVANAISGSAYQAIVATTFYPFDQTNGNRVQSIEIVFEQSGSLWGTRTPQIEIFLSKDGINFPAGIPGYPLTPDETPTISGLNAYRFDITTAGQPVYFKAMRIRAACSAILTNPNNKGVLRAVNICLQD